MQELTALIARVAILAALAITAVALLLIGVQLDQQGDALSAAPYAFGAIALFGGAVVTWHLAVSKDSGKSRFRIDYPFVKPYYIEPKVLLLGATKVNMDGHEVCMYDKDRVICDCLRYRNKMDKEIFNKAIQSYIKDSNKNIPKLLEYAEPLRVKRLVKDLIGVWL